MEVSKLKIIIETNGTLESFNIFRTANVYKTQMFKCQKKIITVRYFSN